MPSSRKIAPESSPNRGKIAAVAACLGLLALAALFCVPGLLRTNEHTIGRLPLKGLVALWAGEGNGNDSTGSNPLILTNLSFARGEIGRAFVFNGYSSRARVPSDSSLDMEECDGLTLSAWIKPTTVDNFHPLLEWRSAATTPQGLGVQLSLGQNAKSQGQLAANLVDTAGNSHSLVSPTDAVVCDHFQHVAVSYDKASGVGVLYLDGRVVAQHTWKSFIPKTKGDLWIGFRPAPHANSIAYNSFFAGALDEVAIYNRALTPQEIQTYYEAVRTSINPASGRPSIATPPDGDLPMGLLNEDQRLVDLGNSETFFKYFESRNFAEWSPQERDALEKRELDIVQVQRETKTPRDEYYQAINTLAALRSTRALPLLRSIALTPASRTLRAERSNRARWMATRALGLIGDKSAVPELIRLTYHNQTHTRWWAQISLVRLTGQNFGSDWQAWGKWWNSQHGQPPFNPEIVQWMSKQPKPEALAASQAVADRKFLQSVAKKIDLEEPDPDEPSTNSVAGVPQTADSK